MLYFHVNIKERTKVVAGGNKESKYFIFTLCTKIYIMTLSYEMVINNSEYATKNITSRTKDQ